MAHREAYSWPEGSIAIWTGNAAPVASAVIAYCENINFTPTWGWDDRPSLSGIYRDHLTGYQAQLVVGAVYQADTTLQKMAQSATALHIKLIHSSVNGTAGYVLYSGRIDSLPLAGNAGQVFKYTMNYHANVWSAF